MERAKKPTEAAQTEAPARVLFGTKLPPDLLARLRVLAARVSMQQGHRVTIEALIEEAVSDLLAKHRG